MYWVACSCFTPCSDWQRAVHIWSGDRWMFSTVVWSKLNLHYRLERIRYETDIKPYVRMTAWCTFILLVSFSLSLILSLNLAVIEPNELFWPWYMALCILNCIIALKQQRYKVVPAFKRGEILPSSVDALYKWLPTLGEKKKQPHILVIRKQ